MHTLATRESLLTQFHAMRHPSYPNYLAMVGGQAFDIADAVQQELNARTIADLLEEKQLTWTQYAEGFPGQCFLVVVMRATPESMCLGCRSHIDVGTLRPSAPGYAGA